MAAPEHVGFADELVQPPRSLGLRSETDVPVADLIALQIGERPAIDADDELREIWMIEIAADEYQRLGVVPPFGDMRLSKLTLHHRQVIRCHRPEGIGRRSHRWPRSL